MRESFRAVGEESQTSLVRDLRIAQDDERYYILNNLIKNIHKLLNIFKYIHIFFSICYIYNAL